MTSVIYLDVIVPENILMNFVILWTTARFSLIEPKLWRLLLGAIVGAAYVIGMFFFQPTGVGEWLGKLCLGALIIFASFGSLPWRRFCIVYVTFFLTSFAVGGIVFGVIFWLQGGGKEALFIPSLIKNHLYVGISFSLLITILVGFWGVPIYRKRCLQKECSMVINIFFWGKKITLKALLDTGNTLTDTLTGYPVVVINYRAVLALLPGDLGAVYDQNGIIDHSKLLKENMPWYNRLVFIPYRSIGKENGAMLGFKPDFLEIQFGRQKMQIRKVVIGIHPGKVSLDNGYEALMHPELIPDEQPSSLGRNLV